MSTWHWHDKKEAEQNIIWGTSLSQHTLDSYASFPSFIHNWHALPDSKIHGANVGQGSCGQHGAHLGPGGPRWAPCWPHELCYLGCLPWRCDMCCVQRLTNVLSVLLLYSPGLCVILDYILWSYYLRKDKQNPNFHSTDIKNIHVA